MLLASCLCATAATKTWTGQSGGLWSTAANWSPAGAPANDDSLNFPLLPGGRTLAMTNDLVGRTFTDLTFTVNGYSVRGNAITLTDGINAAQANLGNILYVPITLSGHQAFNVGSTSATLLLSGDINLNRANLSLNGGGNINFGGVISNRGSVVMVGSNSVTLFGTASNRFDGTMWVQNGTLILNKVSGGVGQIAVPGDLIVGVTKPATVRLVENNQIAPDADVTIYRRCVLDLDGQTNTVGSLRFVGGGTVQTGKGQLRLGGDVTVEGLGDTAVISGNLYLGNDDRTFQVGDIATGLDLEVSAAVSAGTTGAPFYFGVGLIKAGPGMLRLGGANSYGGLTVVNDGELEVGHNLALGAGGGLLAGTRVNSNAVLRLVSVHVPDEPLMLNQTTLVNYVLRGYGDCTWGGTIALNADSRLWSGGTLVLSNRLSGAGGLYLEGATFELAGAEANTYAGTTWTDCNLLRLNHSVLYSNAIPGDLVIGAGSLVPTSIVQFARSQQIADSATVTLCPNGVLDLNGRADWVDEVAFEQGTSTQPRSVQTGAGWLGVQRQVTAAPSSGGRLAGNLKLGPDTVFQLATPIGVVVVDAMISEGGFRLRGGGYLWLESANTFAGPVVVEEGILWVINDFALGAATAGTTVQPGGILNLLTPVTSLNEPLTLSGDGLPLPGYGALLAQSDVTLPNTVTLASNAVVFVASSNNLTISGVINGTGDLTKAGEGTLALTGTAGNTFAGDLFVAKGRLEMNKTGANSIPRRLVIGGFGSDAEAVNLGNAEVGSATVRRQGRWNLNGFNDAVADLVLADGGDVSAPPPGRLTLSAGCNVAVSFRTGVTGSSTLDGVLGLTGVHTFSVTDQNVPVGDPLELVIPARIEGNGSIVKTGSGNVRLSGSNSFTGNLSIQAGQVHVAHNDALGTGVGGTLVLNNASLILEPGVSILHETLTLNSTGLPDLPPLWAAGETNLWDGLIGLQSAARVGVATNTTLTLSGQIAGVGQLTKEGPGGLILSGSASNSYVGTTWAREGRVECRKTIPHGAIPGALVVGEPDTNVLTSARVYLYDLPQIHPLAAVAVHSRGRLWLERVREQAIGSLEGSGAVWVDYHPDGARLVLGGDHRSTVFSGVIYADFGDSQIVKRGLGELQLDGPVFLPYYTAAYPRLGMVVESGTLRANSGIYNGLVQVLPGAVLAGEGWLPRVTVSGGTLNPGREPGRTVGHLMFDHLSLESNAVVEVDIQGIRPEQYDVIRVTDFWDDGVLTITNTSLRVFLDAAPVEGEPLVIFSADAYPEEPIQGIFNGLPDGARLQVPPFAFRVDYTQPDDDWDDHEVTLTLIDPPLQSGPAQIVGNNALPGRINASECDALYIPVTNTFPTPLTGIRALLTSPAGDLLVTQPESLYPDLPPGGVATNITPFQVSSPGSMWGAVDLELSFTSSGPAFASSVKVESGMPGPLQRFDNPTNYAIPGRMTLEVPVSTHYFVGTIESVQASLHLTHENVGDLEIALVGFDGQTVLLSRALGGTNDSYGTGCEDKYRTTFRDNARNAITSAHPPFAGVFRPLEPLSAFIGRYHESWHDEPWRLRIVNRGRVAGTLACWSLYLSGRVGTNGTGGCLTCVEPVLGTLTTNDPVQIGELYSSDPTTCMRTSLPQVSWTTTEWDSNAGDWQTVTNMAYYQAHLFTNAGPSTCVGVALNSEYVFGSGVFAAAYLETFNPENPAQNHLGDLGYRTSAYERSFSFTVPVGARFLVVVNERGGSALPRNYTLRVTGGDCPPPALTIAPAASPNKAAVSWTSASGGYQLESTPALSPAQFTRVTNAPALVDGQFVITNNATGASRFYRLHKP